MVSQPNALLQDVGLVIIENFVATITLTICLGVFILLFSIGTALLLQRGLRSRSTQAMLFLAVISFISAMVTWAATTAGIIIQVQEAMVENLELPLNERIDVGNHETYQMAVVVEWVGNTMPIIADGVVIWRAWVIFFDNHLAMIGPLLLLLGTIATILTNLVLDLNIETNIASGQGVLTLSNKFYVASLAFSLATNALATIMVAYKLWAHRTLFSRRLGLKQGFTRAQNVLAIIVESGMFYFALQSTNFILTISPSEAPLGSTHAIAKQLFNNMYTQLSGLYPLIIIILINNQRSFVDTCGFSSLDLNGAQTHKHNASAHPATAGPLSFAPPAAINTESLESPSITREDNADVELGVIKRGVENVVRDVDIGKQQASTAPF